MFTTSLPTRFRRPTSRASRQLYNDDLAPVSADRRKWGLWHFAALWVGMAVCIPTYTLASGLIAQGMSWAEALGTILLGNLIVLLPLTLNAHPGTKYGIPFPVLARASFGTTGANVPALMRALVARGWFGIETWIGGEAIYTLAALLFGFTPATAADRVPFLALSPGQFACFMLFWFINIGVARAGIGTIKKLEVWAAPVLIAMGLALLVWAVREAGGLGVVLSDATITRVRGENVAPFHFWAVFWPGLTAVIGFWATLSLNIPDFTRYARRQRDQVLGQAIGLPPTMTLFSFIGIATTCASVLIFGEVIWDPVQLVGRFSSPIVVAAAMFAIALATLSTNIAANVVSPSNDFTNLWPARISFKRGGLITGFVGIVILPWRLYTDLADYIFTWLIGYSTLLGTIAGIMLIDYYVIRRRQLDVAGLYDEHGPYVYRRGYNPAALFAFAVGIIPTLPGFLAEASKGVIHVPAVFDHLYAYG